MVRQVTGIATAFIALIFSGALIAASQAQDCPRGELDKAYCDRDGDLVADTPTDAKQLVNPSTLIFAYTPVEDPAVYTKVWDGFIKHMEKITGKKVIFFPVQSNAAEIEAMRWNSTRPIVIATATWWRTRRRMPKKLVDPPTLIFSYTRSRIRQSTRRFGTGSSNTSRKKRGSRSMFFPVQSNAAQSRRCVPAACTLRASTREPIRSP